MSKTGYQKSEFCLKQGRKISDFCLKQDQGMRGRAAPPHPRIHRVPPPRGGVKVLFQDKTRQDNVLFGVLYSPMYIEKKNECEGFIRFPNATKHLKPRGRRPSGFIVFGRLETWWNPKHEFLKWLLERNNAKLCSVVFFPFFCKIPCMCDLLY